MNSIRTHYTDKKKLILDIWKWHMKEPLRVMVFSISRNSYNFPLCYQLDNEAKADVHNSPSTISGGNFRYHIFLQLYFVHLY